MTETAGKRVADTLTNERHASDSTSTIRAENEKGLRPSDITEEMTGNSPTFSRHLQDSFRKRLNSLDIAGMYKTLHYKTLRLNIKTFNNRAALEINLTTCI